MEQNFSATKLPTSASTQNTGSHGTPSTWSNPTRITTDDGSSATWGAFEPGMGASITGSDFDFPAIPDAAIIDGIELFIDGTQTGCFGDIDLNISGSTGKAISSLNGVYGGPTDLWGKTSISAAEIAALAVTADTNDVSGGDGFASMDYMSVTVYWHIELPAAPAEVPTRVDYKVYSSTGRYLGLLPKVTNPFAFAQDINSAGSSIDIVCGIKADNILTTENLTTGDLLDITTAAGVPLTVTTGEVIIARGDSEDDAIFKNGNRVKAWMYNYWHPNGKLMFSGQVNKVKPKYAGGKSYTKVNVLSDGLDLNNLIARGFPFTYTNDQSQTSNDGFVTVTRDGGKGAGYNSYGQSFVVGGAVTNIGAISLLIQGTADVTINVYAGPNSNLLGSVTKSVSHGSPTVEQFEFAQLIDVTPGSTKFFAVWVNPGQSLNVYHNGAGGYTDGTAYEASYAGGSGGGSFGPYSGDLYFVTKSGTPTTTTTYSTQDPITGMMAGILEDYNNRGGYITERDFTPAGYNLTYTFNMAFVFDALRKVLEMSPTGYYAYIDLGTAEMDILEMSETPDFTVVNDRDVVDLELELSIEQVKNYLLLTGGDTGGGANLYRDYRDTESSAAYGIRTATKSDNRMTVTATADAIGDSFIEENSDETEQTSLIVPVTAMDHSLLVPGKTIGFKNYGNFIDTLVVPIVRREFNTKFVVLTLGKLPVRMNDEVQRINRDLLNEQTINNPTSPS